MGYSPWGRKQLDMTEVTQHTPGAVHLGCLQEQTAGNQPPRGPCERSKQACSRRGAECHAACETAGISPRW